MWNNWSVSDFTIYHVIKIDLFKQIESILAILSEIHIFVYSMNALNQ